MEIDQPITAEEAREWAKQQIRDYHAGRLTRRQIRKLESLPGWRWDEAAIDAKHEDRGHEEAGQDEVSETGRHHQTPASEGRKP